MHRWNLFIISRLTNLQLSFNKDTIWNVVKRIKGETSDVKKCYNGLYQEKLSLVKAIEQEMQTEPEERRFENITTEELNISVEMFIYLNTCPYGSAWILWFKSWSSFYDDLFRTKSADQIILTLNRMMKTKALQNQDGKLRAKELLKRTASLLSLKFEEIESFLPGKVINFSPSEGLLLKCYPFLWVIKE